MLAWMLLLQAGGGVHPAWGQPPGDVGAADLVIESVRSFDLEADPSGPVRLPPNHRSLEVHYTVRGADPGAYAYASWLEGYERRWYEAGAQRVAYYRHLRPGAYTFHVRAVGPEGALGPVSLPVVVERRWYELPWVALLLALLAIGAVVGVYRLQTLRLRRQAAELAALVEKRTAELTREKERAEAARAEAEHEREATRQALATVEEQAIQLLRIDHLKSRLFANLSHEFRTPLTLVLDPLDRLLREEGTAERERRSLEQARTNALRVLHLVNQVLDLAKLEAGAMDLRARAGDLVPFIRQTTEIFHSEAARRGVDLQFRSELTSLPAYFDGGKLEKVIFNLISNALKATGEGGNVLVSLLLREETPPGVAEIVVQDTGVGIPSAEVRRIFDRFFQAESGRKWGGTGIGLALVKELVELHHGEVHADSLEGFGSTFTVRLPLGRDHLSPQEVLEGEPPPPLGEQEEAAAVLAGARTLPDGAPAPAPAPAERDRPLVLVVEDNAEIRALICAHLRPAYATAEAGDGVEGLRCTQELRPALVLTDLAMPEMDGLELCRRIRADDRIGDTPVLMLTAHASSQRRLEGLGIGADDFLTKPFDAEELLLRVGGLIRSREALRSRYRQEVVVKPLGRAVPSAEAAFLARVYDTVAEHLADEGFNVPALAEAVGVSESQLKRRLRQVGEASPVEFIRARRLERAAELLAAHFGSVSEVALEVGFGSASYFARCFRERYGVAPSEYAAHLAGAGGQEDGAAPGGDGR